MTVKVFVCDKEKRKVVKTREEDKEINKNDKLDLVVKPKVELLWFH